MLVARALRPAIALALALAVTLSASAAAAERPRERIKNGQPATAGQFPWTVALLQPDARPGDTAYSDQICGGTLVAADVVVTAAHCVVSAQPADLQVLAGVGALSTTTRDDAHRHAVASIAMHPLEDVEDEETRYDAAVLRLATPVPGAKPVEGLTVRSAGAVAGGDPLTVSGWGRIENDSYPSQLRYADIPSVSDTACPGAWGADFSADDMLCALKASPTVVDACDGDSGGPLVTQPADRTSAVGVTLVGIVSWGSADCDDASEPGVYTRVQAPAIHDWLSGALDGDPANDPRPKPGPASGTPAVSGTPVEGQALTCTQGTFAFDAHGYPTDITYELRRDPATVRTVVGAGPYTLTAADVGHAFDCRVTGRVSGAGGSVTGISAATAAVAPKPVVVEPEPDPDPAEPEPAATSEPTPEPAPAPAPQPLAAAAPPDTSAPHIGKVARRCTGTRGCTFTIDAGDTGTGVATLRGRLTTVSTRPCIRRGRRTRCAMTTTRTVRAARRADGRFALDLRWLPRGRFTLALTAVDGAGNAQRTATTVRFAL